MMASISEHSIRIGNGEDRVYVFIDPLCMRSAEYIKLISQDKEIQKKKSFYIFLYRIKRLNSEKTIQYIYQDENPKSILEDIMIYNDDVDLKGFEVEEETLKIIEKINKVAQTLKIRQRPYLLSFKKGSKYCTVSDGTAPCLE